MLDPTYVTLNIKPVVTHCSPGITIMLADQRLCCRAATGHSSPISPLMYPCGWALHSTSAENAACNPPTGCTLTSFRVFVPDCGMCLLSVQTSHSIQKPVTNEGSDSASACKAILGTGSSWEKFRLMQNCMTKNGTQLQSSRSCHSTTLKLPTF